ncbi:MAG TPA: hypothetical protein IAD07_11135 [Candidatus Fimivicinus intestinavium]|nr:hypothetical protein [Candidatus Fimivicinus intestinavium]
MRKKLTHAQAKKLAAMRPAGYVRINYQCGGETIPILLKNTLSLTETSAFVDRVTLGSFDGEGDYIPEYQELMMFGAILQFLSNVPLPERRDPESGRRLLDLARLHEMMDATDLLTRIRAMYNAKDPEEQRLWKLFDRLECMVLEKLEFRRQQAAGRTKLDGLFESATRLLDHWDGAFDGVDLHAFAQKLSQLEAIDEHKLVEAVLSRRTPVDIHSDHSRTAENLQ